MPSPKLVQQQLIPHIHHKDRKTGRDGKLWDEYVSKLNPTSNGVGDCIEVTYHPRNVRKYAFEVGQQVIIRRCGDVWRIWLKAQ